MAMVFQDSVLYPFLTARENVAFPLRVRHRPPEEVELRVTAEGRAMGIEALFDAKPSQLSAGQHQLVQIAKAMVRAPQRPPVRRAAGDGRRQGPRRHARRAAHRPARVRGHRRLRHQRPGRGDGDGRPGGGDGSRSRDPGRHPGRRVRRPGHRRDRRGHRRHRPGDRPWWRSIPPASSSSPGSLRLRAWGEALGGRTGDTVVVGASTRGHPRRTGRRRGRSTPPGHGHRWSSPWATTTWSRWTSAAPTLRCQAPPRRHPARRPGVRHGPPPHPLRPRDRRANRLIAPRRVEEPSASRPGCRVAGGRYGPRWVGAAPVGGAERSSAGISCRAGRIRTGDPLLPKQVRYQAAPQPVSPAGARRHGILTGTGGCSSMVEPQPSKLVVRVRSPSSAPRATLAGSRSPSRPRSSVDRAGAF